MKKMSNWKKKLAILVAVILAVSTVQLVPTVFANMRAENGDSGTIFSRLANTTNTANNPNDENYENGENPADSTFSTEQNDLTEPPQFTSPPAIGGEEEIVDMPTFDVDFNNVIYNLGRQEITVGVDIFRAEETPWNFRLFDSYGNFTIQLEDNAFFPYEVQFQYQGETFIEWFETPQSTVQIGNHIFSVETVQNNPNLLQSISLTIGNDIIKLRPEPKVFTNELFTPATLLPVPLVSLQTIYLAELGYDRLMLQNVTVSHVLSAAEQFNDNAGVVWVRGLGNDYNIVAGSVLDLSRITGTTQLEFIVGTTLQLDPNNVRYRVNVNPELDVIIREVQLFGEDMNGARFEIATNTPEDTSTLDTTSTLQSVTFDIQQPLLGFDNVFLGLSIDPELLNAPNRVLRVLRGNFATPEAALNALNTISGVDITRQIFNPNLSNANTGFAIENAGDHVFTLLFVAQNDLSNVLSLSRLFVSISAERDNFITNVRAFRDIGNTRTVVAEVEPTEPTRGLIPEQSAIFTLEQVDFGDLSSHFITFDLHESINPVRVQIINGWWGSAQTALAAVANAPSLDVTRDILIWNAEIAGRGGFRLTHGFSPNFSIVFYDHLNQVIGFTRLTTYITYSGAFPTVQNVQINQLVDNVRTPVVNQNLFGTGVTQTVNITNFPSAYNFINPPHFLSIALNENLPEHTDVQIVRGIYGNAAAVAAAVSANPQLNVTEDILNHEVGLRLLSSGNQNFGLVFYNEGDVIGFRQLNVNIRVTTPPAPTPGADPYMSMRGALDSNGNPITDYYIMPYQHDTYFSHGFQTIFFLDGDLDLSNVRPVFTNPDDVNVFAGTITEPGLLQESGVTERNFSQGPQQYAALSAVGRRGLRNYIVTFVKLHQGGSQLFVNGINGPQGAIREVFLNSSNNIHDIFIANIGDQPLTGLNVTLNASNVRLDEYWTVGGPGNNTLAAFTTTETPATGSGFYGELPNVAKIRIVADGEGPIFGQLRITANGHEQVIQITGTAGDPFITTEFLYDGVLYVPYQSVIMIHNMYPWNRPSFSIVDGSLPEGLVLRPSGEIYGAPLETGEFTFTVRLDNSHASFASTEAEFTLTILPNSNANVFDQTDVNHEIMQHLGTPIGGDARTGGFLIEDPAEQRLFLSAGLHEEFIDFWLNGTRLLRGIHYEDEPGSTRIIVHEQTLTNLARQTGINTIAAEFRERADVGTDYEVGGRLNRSAQNFTFNRPATGGGDGGDGGNGGNGGNGDQGGGNVGGGGNQGGGNISGGGNVSGGGGHETDGNVTTQAPRPPANNANQGQNQVATAPPAPTPQPTPQPTPPPVIEAPEVEIVTMQPFSIENGSGFILPMSVIASTLADPSAIIVLNMGEMGTITLNRATLLSLGALFGEMITFNVTLVNGQVAIEVLLDETPLNTVNGGLRLALPNIAPFAVPENEVTVLLTSNGTTSLINKSFVENGTVYVLIDSPGTIIATSNFTPFNDVEPTNWFAGVVQFISNRGMLAVNTLINGVGNLFNPTVLTTRGETVNAFFELENFANGNFFGGTTTFSDVSSEDAHANGINWAASVGIIQGFGDGTFRADDNVTRQQIAIILMNYANVIGLDTSARGYIGDFSDFTQIAPWADDAVRWAVANNLMQGDGSSFNPNNNATRAEVSQIVQNMIRLLVR